MGLGVEVGEGGVGSTYPVCNGDDSVSGFGFQLLETRGRKKASCTLSPKQDHLLAGMLGCLTQSQGAAAPTGWPGPKQQAPTTSAHPGRILGLGGHILAGCYPGLHEKAMKQKQTKACLSLFSGVFSPQPPQHCSKGALWIDFKLEISPDQRF